MNEGVPKVITAVLSSQIDLPDTPHALFVRGELADAVSAPEGARVEVIGGEIVVSPAPGFQHGALVEQISRAFHRALLSRPDFPWEWQQNAQVDFLAEEAGCIPDLVVGEAEAFKGVFDAGTKNLVSDEIEMVIEVTSPGNAWRDRPPVAGRITKWSNYARAEIPYYLLIDCDSKVAKSVLYTIPHAATGAYLDEQEWAFGETVVLPDPFGLKIPTDEWRTWA